MKSTIKWHYGLNIAYFAVVVIDLIAELFVFNFLSLISRIVLPILLSLIYFSSSKVQNRLFYLITILLLICNVLFFFRESYLFFYGVVAFILLRITAIGLILKLTEAINYLHIVVASFPLLLIFFYLISVTNDITEIEFNTLVLQSILISTLAGISISNYLKNENRQNSWLLISTLLFIGLRFIVFIEKYIVSDLTLFINRPIAVLLNAFAFYTFYKYVIASEGSSIS